VRVAIRLDGVRERPRLIRYRDDEAFPGRAGDLEEGIGGG